MINMWFCDLIWATCRTFRHCIEVQSYSSYMKSPSVTYLRKQSISSSSAATPPTTTITAPTTEPADSDEASG